MSLLTKIIYATLFAVLLLQPHLIQRHIFPTASPYAENAVTVGVFALGFLTYFLHQRDLKKKELENQQLGESLKDEHAKLLASFEYMGFVNRRLPLLQNLTSDLLSDFKDIRKEKKRIFERLLNVAVVSIVNAEWGLLRFIHEGDQRTLKEFSYARTKNQPLIQLGNKDLLQTRGQKNNHNSLGEYSSIVNSNSSRPERCFLVLPKQNNLQEEDLAILRAIVDQALLFYSYTYPTEAMAQNRDKI